MDPNTGKLLTEEEAAQSDVRLVTMQGHPDDIHHIQLAVAMFNKKANAKAKRKQQKKARKKNRK